MTHEKAALTFTVVSAVAEGAPGHPEPGVTVSVDVEPSDPTDAVKGELLFAIEMTSALLRYRELARAASRLAAFRLTCTK